MSADTFADCDRLLVGAAVVGAAVVGAAVVGAAVVGAAVVGAAAENNNRRDIADGNSHSFFIQICNDDQ